MPKIGPAQVDDEAADRCLFGHEPRIGVLLPDILGATHHHHEVIRFKVGNGLSRIDFHGLPRQSVVLHERPENARMLDVQMLQHDNFHSGPSLLMGERGA